MFAIEAFSRIWLRLRIRRLVNLDAFAPRNPRKGLENWISRPDSQFIGSVSNFQKAPAPRAFPLVVGIFTIQKPTYSVGVRFRAPRFFVGFQSAVYGLLYYVSAGRPPETRWPFTRPFSRMDIPFLSPFLAICHMALSAGYLSHRLWPYRLTIAFTQRYL